MNIGNWGRNFEKKYPRRTRFWILVGLVVLSWLVVAGLAWLVFSLVF